jgi:hypothetical protein
VPEEQRRAVGVRCQNGKPRKRLIAGEKFEEGGRVLDGDAVRKQEGKALAVEGNRGKGD